MVLQGVRSAMSKCIQNGTKGLFFSWLRAKCGCVVGLHSSNCPVTGVVPDTKFDAANGKEGGPAHDRPASIQAGAKVFIILLCYHLNETDGLGHHFLGFVMGCILFAKQII
jgi:hypothetical protein